MMRYGERENGSYKGGRVGREMYARKNARMTVEGRSSLEFQRVLGLKMK